MAFSIDSFKDGLSAVLISSLESLNTAVEKTHQTQVMLEQQPIAKNPAFQENIQEIHTLAFAIFKKMQNITTTERDLTNRTITTIQETTSMEKVLETFQGYQEEFNCLNTEMKTMNEEFTYVTSRLNVLETEIDPPAWELHLSLIEKYQSQ